MIEHECKEDMCVIDVDKRQEGKKNSKKYFITMATNRKLALLLSVK